MEAASPQAPDAMVDALDSQPPRAVRTYGRSSAAAPGEAHGALGASTQDSAALGAGAGAGGGDGDDEVVNPYAEILKKVAAEGEAVSPAKRARTDDGTAMAITPGSASSQSIASSPAQRAARNSALPPGRKRVRGLSSDEEMSDSSESDDESAAAEAASSTQQVDASAGAAADTDAVGTVDSTQAVDSTQPVDATQPVEAAVSGSQVREDRFAFDGDDEDSDTEEQRAAARLAAQAVPSDDEDAVAGAGAVADLGADVDNIWKAAGKNVGVDKADIPEAAPAVTDEEERMAAQVEAERAEREAIEAIKDRAKTGRVSEAEAARLKEFEEAQEAARKLLAEKHKKKDRSIFSRIAAKIGARKARVSITASDVMPRAPSGVIAAGFEIERSPQRQKQKRMANVMVSLDELPSLAGEKSMFNLLCGKPEKPSSTSPSSPVADEAPEPAAGEDAGAAEEVTVGPVAPKPSTVDDEAEDDDGGGSVASDEPSRPEDETVQPPGSEAGDLTMGQPTPASPVSAAGSAGPKEASSQGDEQVAQAAQARDAKKQVQFAPLPETAPVIERLMRGSSADQPGGKPVGRASRTALRVALRSTVIRRATIDRARSLGYKDVRLMSAAEKKRLERTRKIREAEAAEARAQAAAAAEASAAAEQAQAEADAAAAEAAEEAEDAWLENEARNIEAGAPEAGAAGDMSDAAPAKVEGGDGGKSDVEAPVETAMVDDSGKAADTDQAAAEVLTETLEEAQHSIGDYESQLPEATLQEGDSISQTDGFQLPAEPVSAAQPAKSDSAVSAASEVPKEGEAVAKAAASDESAGVSAGAESSGDAAAPASDAAAAASVAASGLSLQADGSLVKIAEQKSLSTFFGGGGAGAGAGTGDAAAAPAPKPAKPSGLMKFFGGDKDGGDKSEGEADGEEGNDGGDEQDSSSDEGEDSDEEMPQRPKGPRNAAYRKMLEQDAARAAQQKSHKGAAFAEEQAEEEEEVDHTAGMGDFGLDAPKQPEETTKQTDLFGNVVQVPVDDAGKKDDEDEGDLEIREEDLEAVVDEMSDDEEQGNIQGMHAEQAQEKDDEHLQKVVEQVEKGWGRRKKRRRIGGMDYADREFGTDEEHEGEDEEERLARLEMEAAQRRADRSGSSSSSESESESEVEVEEEAPATAAAAEPEEESDNEGEILRLRFQKHEALKGVTLERQTSLSSMLEDEDNDLLDAIANSSRALPMLSVTASRSRSAVAVRDSGGRTPHSGGRTPHSAGAPVPTFPGRSATASPTIRAFGGVAKLRGKRAGAGVPPAAVAGGALPVPTLSRSHSFIGHSSASRGASNAAADAAPLSHTTASHGGRSIVSGGARAMFAADTSRSGFERPDDASRSGAAGATAGAGVGSRATTRRKKAGKAAGTAVATKSLFTAVVGATKMRRGRRGR